MTKRQTTGIAACAAAMDIANAPIPMHILMQSPAETEHRVAGDLPV